MKAVVYRSYGPPTVLKLEEIPKPTPTDNEILIKIDAVSINGSDRENLIGKPLYTRFGGLRRPKQQILGSDIAGRVEFVGKNISEFKVGDEVFGEIPGYHGGFAEYVCTSGRTMIHKPANLTFAQAAAIPQAGIIAYKGLYEKGNVQHGQQVLINGAGGSAGSFAIQLAKLYGAEVTGVDSRDKLPFLRSLGADHVIDYAEEDFTKNGKQYDLILEVIGHRSVFAYRRSLNQNGTLFFVGGSARTLFQLLIIGPLIKRISGKNLQLLAVPQTRKDLQAISALCEAGQVTPAIDRIYSSLHEAPEALKYVGEGKAKGKVVITIGED